MSDAAAKYAEYSDKATLWAVCFREDFGREPTEDDKQRDPQYQAIEHKLQRYHKAAAARRSTSSSTSGGAGDPSAASSSSAHHHHQQRHSHSHSHSHSRKSTSFAAQQDSQDEDRGGGGAHDREAGDGHHHRRSTKQQQQHRRSTRSSSRSPEPPFFDDRGDDDADESGLLTPPSQRRSRQHRSSTRVSSTSSSSGGGGGGKRRGGRNSTSSGGGGGGGGGSSSKASRHRDDDYADHDDDDGSSLLHITYAHEQPQRASLSLDERLALGDAALQHNASPNPTRTDSSFSTSSQQPQQQQQQQQQGGRGRSKHRTSSYDRASSASPPDVRTSTADTRSDSSEVEQSNGFLGGEMRPHTPGDPLPRLPRPIGTLATKAEWVVADARAKVALEKCNKWVVAFQQQQGSNGQPPPPEVRASSSTYSSFEKKYISAVEIMLRLISDEVERIASLDDTLGVRASPALKGVQGTEDADQQKIRNRRRASITAADQSRMEEELIVQRHQQRKQAAEAAANSNNNNSRTASPAGARVGFVNLDDKPRFDASNSSSAQPPQQAPPPPQQEGGGGLRKRHHTAVMAVNDAPPAEGEGASALLAATSASASDPKSGESLALLREACRKCILFTSLSSAEHELIVKAMVEVRVASGTAVIRQGDVGDNLYVVASGVFDVYLTSVSFGTVSVKTYREGDTFGELALMYNTPRAATVRCTEDGVLWSLERRTFRALVIKESAEAEENAREHLMSVPMFESLTSEQLTRLASAAETVVFDERTTVVRQGDVAEHLFIITKGFAYAQKWGAKEKFKMEKKTCFGESALAKHAASDPESNLRKADVIAEPGCQMLKLSAEDFRSLVGNSLDGVARRNFNLKLLGSVKFGGRPVSKLMPASALEKLADAFEEVTFGQGEVVIKEGDVGDCFYIIKTGDAAISTRQKGVIVKIGDGDFFGEMALIKQEPRAASVTCASAQLTCLSISRDKFNTLFGPLQEMLESTANTRTQELGKTSMDDLQLHGILGSGSFGHVCLVLHKRTNTAYALKTMLKGRLGALGQIEHVLQERDVLRKLAHPFIVSLAATLQDADHIYMLMDFVAGGELFSIMQATIFLVDPVATFYTACVASAFEHMHDRSVIYRDLKPENLLLDNTGYLKIVDFGFAKEVKTKTYTLCGTPEYLAPEIILNKGHDKGADWWALGILTYEMLAGAPPFADDFDPMNIYKKILEAKLPEPKKGMPPLSKGARSFIEKLCMKEVAQRLGCMKNGAEDVRTHPFLSRINWRRLEKKLLQPPCTPQLNGPMDTSAYTLLSSPPYHANEFRKDLTPKVQALFKEW